MISIIFGGKNWTGFSPSELIQNGVPEDIVNTAVKSEKWDVIRKSRDRLISDTDYTQMPDSPLSIEKKAEFAEYRQALRDLPQSTDNPDDIVWPVKPE